jgi:hypothetical protein
MLLEKRRGCLLLFVLLLLLVEFAMAAVSMDPDMLVEIIRPGKPFVTALIRTFES